MGLVTDRLALPYPEPTDPDNVPAWMQALALTLDANMLGQQRGTLAARPAVTAARLYDSTDALTYLSDGATWRSLQGTPTPATGRWFLNGPDGSDAGIDLGASGTTPVTIPWTPDWQVNGFATSGPVLYVPEPGIYRVHAVVSSFHRSNGHGGFYSDPMNRGLWLFQDAGGLCAFSQTTGEDAAATFAPYYSWNTVEVTCNVPLGKTGPGSLGVYVQYANSYNYDPWYVGGGPGAGDGPGPSQAKYIEAGRSHSYIEMQRIAAL